MTAFTPHQPYIQTEYARGQWLIRADGYVSVLVLASASVSVLVLVSIPVLVSMPVLELLLALALALALVLELPLELLLELLLALPILLTGTSILICHDFKLTAKVILHQASGIYSISAPSAHTLPLLFLLCLSLLILAATSIQHTGRRIPGAT